MTETATITDNSQSAVPAAPILDTTSMNFSPTIVGSTTEFVAGERKPGVCYGTYAGDLLDETFRFRVSFVEHDGRFEMHSHEYAELVIVLAGHAMHLTDLDNHPLETGDVVVINAGRKHGFAEAKGLRLCNIMYDPQQFLVSEHELETLAGYQALFELGPRSERPASFRERLHLSIQELAQINTMLSALRQESERKDDGWKAVVRYQFLSMVAFVSRIYTRLRSDQATPLLQMARVVSYIQQNYHTPIAVEQLAKLAHLSLCQFQRRFKRVHNQTPIQFVNNVRIHAACEMLKDPNNDVTHVAMATGFSTSAFFSAQFRRHMGESPSSYRRRFNTEMIA